MYYTIYKIANKINGKIYIGSHKTKNLDDNYMGSGKYLKYSQEKHGLENFDKEILFVFDNPEDMFSKEAELVNEELIAEENTYNLKVGGCGGWEYNNTTEGQKLRSAKYNLWQEAGNAKFVERFNNDTEFKEKTLKRLNEQSKKAKKTIKEKYPDGTFKGKTHSTETKNIMSEKAKQRLKDPTKNSQYGSMWITNGIESKKIKKDDLILDGWKKGRKICKR